MNPFDFVNDISWKKNYLLNDKSLEREYNSFIVNRTFGYHPDTVFFANEMNRCWFLDKKMQFDFLFFSIKKSKRFADWIKPKKDDDLQATQEYYGYSRKKASEALKILTKDDLKDIRKMLHKGGKSKK